jgi:hypothetical protein
VFFLFVGWLAGRRGCYSEASIFLDRLLCGHILPLRRENRKVYSACNQKREKKKKTDVFRDNRVAAEMFG